MLFGQVLKFFIPSLLLDSTGYCELVSHSFGENSRWFILFEDLGSDNSTIALQIRIAAKLVRRVVEKTDSVDGKSWLNFIARKTILNLCIHKVSNACVDFRASFFVHIG